MSEVRVQFNARLKEEDASEVFCRAVFDGAAQPWSDDKDKPGWILYACLWLLTHQEFASSGEAQALLRTAEDIAKDLRKAELRSVHATLAVIYNRQRDTQSAARSLGIALDGERDGNKRSLLLRNLAKVYLVGGDLTSALKTCNRISEVKDCAPENKAAVNLLRVRILTNLAADAHADKELDQIDHDCLGIWPLSLEFAYIRCILDMSGLLAGPSSKSGQLIDRYQLFLDGIDEERKQSRAFYELELEMFRLFSSHRAIKNQQAFQSRCRHLARTANASWMGIFILKVMQVLKAKEGPDQAEMREDLKEELVAFSKTDNEASFHLAGMLLAAQFLKMGVPSMAGFVVGLVNDQITKLRGQLSPSILKVIEGEESAILSQIETLNKKLPTRYKLASDDWLLSG